MTPTALRSTPSNSTAAPTTPERKSIPFDYAFRFELKGSPGRVTNSIVSISVEAQFTAVSIGYGVIPTVQPVVFGPAPPPPPPDGGGVILLATNTTTTPQDLFSISLGQIFQGLDTQLKDTTVTLNGNDSGADAVFKNGLKLNPNVAELALQANSSALSTDVLNRLFQVVASPSEFIQFKYAIFDEGSGREFQSEPILNIAGLGSANGERPFRYFAQPITFRPRSTIRMEVTEVSDFEGELQVALQGYKVLGDPNSPTGAPARRRR
ncbi:MAG TPA: hypothetical protein VKB46_20575 [Pyrinomonadaceae bacterium]|nr:hypothetical protein [Pyrinomonadaceae bacterium]